MKALVTGSDGFIGTHLCTMLREDGHDVIRLDKKSGNDVITCDLPNDVHRVFHLAAQTNARCADGLEDARDNILSAVRVFSHYRSKVIFASSSAVNYLVSPYGISKLACEHYAQFYGCGIVRFCNIHGPGSKSFIDLYVDLPYVNANLPGNQVRTYAHVLHACEALLHCKPGELNVLGGVDLTVDDIIKNFYEGKKINWFAPNEYDVIEGRQVYGVQS